MESILSKTIRAGTCDVPVNYQHLYGKDAFLLSTDRRATHCVHSSSKGRVWTRALTVRSKLMYVWRILESELQPSQLVIVRGVYYSKLQPAAFEADGVLFDLKGRQWIGAAPTDPATEHIPDILQDLLASATYPVLMYAKHFLRQQTFVHTIAPAMSATMTAAATVIESRALLESLVFPFLQDAPIEWAVENKERVEKQVEFALDLLSFVAAMTSRNISTSSIVKIFLEQTFQTLLKPDRATVETYSALTFCTELQNPLAPDASPLVSRAYVLSKLACSLDLGRVAAVLEIVCGELTAFVRNPNVPLFSAFDWSACLSTCLIAGTSLATVAELFMEFKMTQADGGNMNLFAAKAEMRSMRADFAREGMSDMTEITKTVEGEVWSLFDERAKDALMCFGVGSAIVGQLCIKMVQYACKGTVPVPLNPSVF